MIILPAPVIEALERLESAGFEAYVVGACVRELILGNSPQDYDIVTNADINDIMFAFREYRISDEGMSRGSREQGHVRGGFGNGSRAARVHDERHGILSEGGAYRPV